MPVGFLSAPGGASEEWLTSQSRCGACGDGRESVSAVLKLMVAQAAAVAVDDRLREACHEYDGDACRPESGITAERAARMMLEVHLDICRCYCPACVVAREFLQGERR